ncbi:PAS-domain containing protein [Planktotalea sp.]|uniref:hybrid sensor histidine kinase/response regulator n=1 Tax=Planktotalea sp. TaxID=2029877 RepID=UPI003D6BDC5B
MSLINPNDTIERQNEKLLQIAHSLMRRVEQKNEQSGLAYQQFERAALLESEVRQRTHDLERALDLLQESNARLAIANDETENARANLTEAIETINEGFALFEADGGLALSNSRFCRDLTDIKEQLVEGLMFEDYVELVSRSKYLALPEGHTPAHWAAHRLEKHGEEHVEFNVRLRWDRWLQISEHRTSRGGTVILQTDVTTIMRRERQARDQMRDKQAEILQATLDHLNQGVCIFDNQMSLVGWNSRMDGLLAGAPQRGVLRMGFDVLLDRLEKQLRFEGRFSISHLRKWANQTERRQPLAFEVTRGRTQIFSVFAQEMPDRGFVISFTDVTAERSAARTLAEVNSSLERRVQDRTRELGVALAEAERANASKTRFVTAASHDLLQPLSAAKLYLTSLSERIDFEGAQDVLNKTEMALNSVEHFISTLLDISTLDAHQAVFEVQPVALSQVFTPLRNEMTPLAVEKGIELTVLQSGLTVLSDPGYLRRIVQNLLSNAIRYTDTGRVLVGVRRIGGIARIQVFDTGKGIAQEDHSRIFKEFERLSPTNTDVGLGLGLSIVEQACKGLGHQFALKSTVGEGSCFSVDVALNAAPESELSSGGLAEEKIANAIVLLIEPASDKAMLFTEIVEAEGPTVIHAHSSAEAFDILKEVQLTPDVILSRSADALLSTQKLGALPIGLLTGEGADKHLVCEVSRDSMASDKPLDAIHIKEFLKQALAD